MNTDEKIPNAVGGVEIKYQKEEPIAVIQAAGAPDNGEERPVRKNRNETPVEVVTSGPEQDAGTTPKPRKRGLMTVAVSMACVAVVATGLLALKSCGRTDDDTSLGDTPSQTETAQPTTRLPEVMETEPETEPTEETLSQEELEYLAVEEYCRGLELSGDYLGALRYLEVYAAGDARYEELLAYFAGLYEEDTLNTAAGYADRGQYRQAIQLLENAFEAWYCQDFYHTAAQYRMDFGVYNTSILVAGKLNTFLLHRDGTVEAFGHSMYGEMAANNWTGITALSAGDRHVVGLRADGTVVAAGSNDVHQMDVGSWYDIVAISGGDTHTVGLKSDGTVVAVGYNEHNQCDMQTLMRNAGGKRIVSVAAGYGHTLALLEDGTVAVTGVNEYGECNVSGWTDIVAIYAGSEFSAGLRADGTVVVTGLNASKWDVESWTDIVNLSAGDYYLVGLKADGTVVAAGTNDSNYSERGQMNVYGWSDIVMIAAGNDHTAALRADGTVLCIGSNDLDQCECHGVVLDYQ